MKRRLLTYCICLLLAIQTFAEKGVQTQVDLGLGLHSMYYNPSDGESKSLLGGKFGATCSYFFTNNVGIGLGAYFGLSQSKYNLSQGYRSDVMQDTLNDFTYQLNSDISLEETHRLLMVNFPLSFRSMFALNEAWSLHANVGAMLNVPVYKRYDSYLNQSITAHYFEPNIDFHDMPNHGFSTQNIDNSGEYWLQKFSMSPFVEVGLSRQIATKCRLYLGLYCAYDVTNSLKDNSNEAVYYETANVPESTTSFASNFTNELKTFSVGVNIGLIFKEHIKYVQTYDDSLSLDTEMDIMPDTLEATPIIDTLPCIDFVDSVEVRLDTMKKETLPKTEVKKIVKTASNQKKVRLHCTHGLKVLLRFNEPLSDDFTPETERKLKLVAKSMEENPMEKVVIFSENKQPSSNVNAQRKEVTFLFKIKKYLMSCGVKSSQIVFGMDASKK